MRVTRSNDETAAAQAGLRRHLEDTRIRRGDVVAWARIPAATYVDGRAVQAERLYTIGIVTKVVRGIAVQADTGLGLALINHDIESAGVRGERLDLDQARAWLASDANYPRPGSSPLRSMDDVRAIVRQWLKADG